MTAELRSVELTGDGGARRAYLLVLSLLAASFMLFQISLLRELRFQLNTVFTLTPFLFGSVIALIGAGSLAAGWMSARLAGVLRFGVAILPLILLPLFAVTVLIASTFSPLQPQAVSADEYLRSAISSFLLVALLGYGPVFVLQGLIFALYFREGRRAGILSDVYATDLFASGLGALCGGVLVFLLTPIQMVMVASTLALVTVWVARRLLALPLSLVAAETLLLAGIIALEFLSGPIARAESVRWLERGLSYSTWSPYRRIDAVEEPKRLLVFADGLLFHMYEKGDRTHAWDPRAIPVRLLPRDGRPDREILVIGAGTGSDVRILRDLHSEQLRVVAVEIDEGFIRTARAFPWLWQSYSTADIVVQEGRYFLEHGERQFDAVIYAYVDPQAAISTIGLPDANFLYTDAGIRSAHRRVKDGGLLIITRVFLVQQQHEFVRRLCATLAAAGIAPRQIGLYRHKAGVPWGYYGYLSTIHVVVGKGDSPPRLEDEALVPMECIGGGRPTTDSFPFSLVTRAWFGTLGDYIARHPAVIVLLALLGFGLIARVSTGVGHFHFFVLGFGSFLVESLVLLNSFLLIGNPILSAAVAVGCFLIWNALGSRYSERLQAARWFYPVVPVGVFAYAVTAPLLNGYTIALPVALRVLIFALHLSVAGVVVGAMFPISLRRFADERVSTMFFIDLIGCSLAPVAFWLAMSLAGVWLVVAGAVGSYLAVAVILATRRGWASA